MIRLVRAVVTLLAVTIGWLALSTATAKASAQSPVVLVAHDRFASAEHGANAGFEPSPPIDDIRTTYDVGGGESHEALARLNGPATRASDGGLATRVTKVACSAGSSRTTGSV